MFNKKALKTLAPVGILIVVIGIWFAKNLPQQEELSRQADLKFPLTVASVDIKELQAHKMPIIIDFGADSCIPCKEMAPVLSKLNTEMQDSVIIQFVDVWKNPDSAKSFPLQVIPTQFFFTADSKPYVPSDNLDLEFTLYADKDTGAHLYTVHQGGLTEEQLRVIIEDMKTKSSTASEEKI